MSQHDHDPVAEALRHAGPRPAMPDLDLETLGAPALAVWQRQTRRRRRRRMALAATLVLALGGLWLWQPWSPPAQVLARAGIGALPEVGSSIPVGTLLSTGARQWLTVELRGHRLRLDQKTDLRLISPDELELLRGAVYVDAVSSTLRIVAGDTVSEHVGTRYSVHRVDDGVSVRVRHGQVRVTRGEQVVELVGGQGAHTAEDLVPVDVPVSGDTWAWTRHAAPAFESAGATLEEVFAWIEAETGWTVEVAQELLLEHDGSPVIFSGEVGHLDLEQALETTVEISGLVYTREGDRGRIVASP